MTQHTLINLHSNDYSQGLCYYLFAVDLDRCVRSCDALNELSNRVCVPNKTEDWNLHVSNIITEINEWKAWAKQISCERKCNFMVENITQIKSGIIKYVGVSAKMQKNIMHTKKIISGVLLHEVLKMVNIYEVLLMIHCLPVMKL